MMAKVYSNLMNFIFCKNSKYQMQKIHRDTWNKTAFLSPSYALHASKIIDKMSGKADCTLAWVQQQKKDKGRDPEEQNLCLMSREGHQ